MASLVAAVQVQECLKLLSAKQWEGRTLVGRQFMFDARAPEADIATLPLREDCPAHVDIAPEDIVELTDFSADSTAASLLFKAQDLLGPSARIYLDQEIALERHCPDCGSVQYLFRPLNQVFREELTCRCGRATQFESDLTTTHIVNASSPSRLLEAKLIDLGVPRFGIVDVQGQAGIEKYFELTGDAGFLADTQLNAARMAVAEGCA
jgi:hypothetical protein